MTHPISIPKVTVEARFPASWKNHSHLQQFHLLHFEGPSVKGNSGRNIAEESTTNVIKGHVNSPEPLLDEVRGRVSNRRITHNGEMS